MSEGCQEPKIASVLAALGEEMSHAAELLRRYERAVLVHKRVADAGSGAASELQLVDLVIQILEDVAPFSRALADQVPDDVRVPPALIEQLRLDQLRVHLAGTETRAAPHSGGHIDVF
jgi:hypothetical protein